MNYHLPIITTDVGGFSETLSDYNPKQLIPPNNVEALTKAMVSMIHSLSSHPPSPTSSPSSSHSSNVNSFFVDTIRQLAYPHS